MSTSRNGRFIWYECLTTDPEKAMDFYQDVVGLSAQEVEMEDAGDSYADYALCTPDGSAVAGVCHARGMNRGLPPVWLIYLPVGDLEDSLIQARTHGGEVVAARMSAAGEGGYAVVRDPVGAYLGLVPG